MAVADAARVLVAVELHRRQAELVRGEGDLHHLLVAEDADRGAPFISAACAGVTARGVPGTMTSPR